MLLAGSAVVVAACSNGAVVPSFARRHGKHLAERINKNPHIIETQIHMDLASEGGQIGRPTASRSRSETGRHRREIRSKECRVREERRRGTSPVRRCGGEVAGAAVGENIAGAA